MFKRAGVLTLVLTVGGLTGAAFAQSALIGAAATAIGADDGAKATKILEVGSKAPGIKVEKFLKGSPISEFESGKVYVVEFWATWCGPCIRAMPHLSELQAKYKSKGVTFIGTNIWEVRGGGAYDDSIIKKVEAFVEKQGDKMAYTVAFDGGAKWMDENYMKAAGQNGIPSSFIVNKEGYIAFIGHPMDDKFEPTLNAILDGTFDLQKAAAEYKAQAEIERKMQPLMRDFSQAWSGNDLAAMEATVTKMIAVSPDDASGPAGALFSKLMDKDTAKAYAFANKAMDGGLDKAPQFLNAVAWTIVDPEGGVQDKDMALALRAGEKAAALQPKNAAILDTLARVYWVKGDKAKAIETQTKAVSHAEGDMKEELEKVLAEYKGK